MSEIDLSGEEPTSRADPVVRTETPPEDATLEFELELFKSRVRFQYKVQGPISWAPLFCALVILVAPASALVLTSQLLPPDATGTMVAVVAAVSGGAVLLGGAAFLLLLPSIARRHRPLPKGGTQ